MSTPTPRPGASARGWMRPFLAALAETSNVARAARRAGVSTATVYEARRRSRSFARAWSEALCEGYDNLEMDLLCRLREGEIKPAAGARKGVRIFDNAIAFRLLAVHREAANGEKAQRANATAADVRASIERKLKAFEAEVRAREEAERERGESGDA